MNARMQSVRALATRVVKENVVGTIRSMSAPLDTDVWIYRMVVAALGLAVLACIAGAVALSMGANPPRSFWSRSDRRRWVVWQGC